MASPHLRRRAWTLYLWMAVLAILLGVLMFVFGGGWHFRTASRPASSIGLFIPAVPVARLG